jgi:hypothetical protein
MKKIISYFAIIIVALISTSCDKFLDVNRDPNNPVEEYIRVEQRLSAALYHTALQEVTQLNQLGSFWGGYWGTSTEGSNTYKKEQLYNGPAIMAKRDGIPIWENSYSYLNYYELMRIDAEGEGAPAYKAIAMVMQAWHYMRLADTYGDIPFTQALQGQKYPRPVYDNGADVYKASIDMLSSAVELLGRSPLPSEKRPGKDDIIFNGDLTKWIKFANTIKLRALLRGSEVSSSSYIQAEISKMGLASSGSTTASLFLTEIAQVQPGFNATNLNPFWSTYYRNSSNKTTNGYIHIRPTQFAIDNYSALSDPRLSRLYAKTKSGDYKGVIFGYEGSDLAYSKENTSPLLGPAENGGKAAAILKSQTQPIILLSAAESWFLLTEAAHRGWISGDAAEYYRNAISASMQQMEVTATERDAYLSRPDVAYNNTLERIILQKWLALNSISGFEAWSDYRRVGLPEIPNTPGTSPNERPRRLLYPETEVQTNIAEVTKRDVSDITTARVWWDKE